MAGFGQEFRRLRQRRGVSLKRLAPDLGVNYTYLSKIENDRSVPSEDLIARTARYFGADQDMLMLAANRIPDDIQRILRDNPREALEYLRKRFARDTGARPSAGELHQAD